MYYFAFRNLADLDKSKYSITTYSFTAPLLLAFVVNWVIYLFLSSFPLLSSSFLFFPLLSTDGSLDREEFAIAFHLCQAARKGTEEWEKIAGREREREGGKTFTGA
jgi:hypothetical protein